MGWREHLDIRLKQAYPIDVRKLLTAVFKPQLGYLEGLIRGCRMFSKGLYFNSRNLASVPYVLLSTESVLTVV